MTENVDDYLNSLSQKLKKRKSVKRPFTEIKTFPIAHGQCMYVLDFKERTAIYQKGVAEFLGYTPDEFTFDLVISTYHPNDYNIVTRLIQATLQFASEHNVSKDVGFFLTYRIRRKDGSYIKVLRQSNVYETDPNGKIISNISMLTDISFIDTSEKVQWRFEAPGLDKQEFKRYITRQYEGFFSERELEVIQLLRNGFTSDAIARKLTISKHSVDGHRRKMLSKSNCTNTIDLINFSKNNGIIAI